MNIIILGAGVVGVTTAYQLAKEGFCVTIIDKHNNAGSETSFANGGQLSYNYKTPIASPEVFRQIPNILLGFDPAFKTQATVNPDFYRWIWRFLPNCSQTNSHNSSMIMQKLGAFAKTELTTIVKESNINFDHRIASGKLYIYQNQQSFQKLLNAHSKSSDTSIWSKEKLHEEIPALTKNDAIAGALFDQEEDSADCQKFCTELTRYLQDKYDVNFLNNCNIQRICTKGNCITGIETTQGIIQGDNYILATGMHSLKLLKPLGIKLPIYPIKGYSITVPATNQCPSISITDTDKKTVYCRLANRLRIAGLAEFVGMDNHTDKNRIDFLLNNARQFLPEAGEYDTVLNSWSGLRPSTPDSLPIVGASSYDNLYFNTGHGMLGWTYSSGTAKLISNLLTNRQQQFDINALSIDRF